jgi:hypothetical protein
MLLYICSQSCQGCVAGYAKILAFGATSELKKDFDRLVRIRCPDTYDTYDTYGLFTEIPFCPNNPNSVQKITGRQCWLRRLLAGLRAASEVQTAPPFSYP